MREILFRGKRKNNGEWVYGNLSKRDDVKEWEYFIGQNSLGYEVIPETVGQYTDLIDIDSKKIFEGDIIKAKLNMAGEKNYAIGIVIFEKGTYKIRVFKLKNTVEYKEYTGAEFKAFSIGNNFISGYFLEKIGNIHDNPELLKEVDSNE